MTPAAQQGHRAKIERVIAEKGGLVISAPVGAPRVRLGYYPLANKFFLYLGFKTQEQAMALFDFLLRKGWATKYNHQQDTGLRLPRKAEYVTGYEWEIKWHRPQAANVNYFISRDKERQAQVCSEFTPPPGFTPCGVIHQSPNRSHQCFFKLTAAKALST